MCNGDRRRAQHARSCSQDASSLSNLPTLNLKSGRAETILDRLQSLYPKLIDLSLGRMQRLLHALGDPQDHLPPVIHVAGTNGKGSTCAFLRAIGEAAGWRVHVTTSPHLVHLRERFRVAGALVDDAVLADTLAEIERVNAGQQITVFEALAAAGFLLFARTPADLCVVEVGLGGRFDATNVVAAPAACAIASISLDHQDFLGDRLDKIAGEKAGIMKAGRPVATGAQAAEVRDVLRAEALRVGAVLLERERDWTMRQEGEAMVFEDAAGRLLLPLPSLPGAFQLDNAGIAVACLRASGLAVPQAAYDGVGQAAWPARLQRLEGRLAALLPAGFALFLDGGHNAGAGLALAEHLRGWADRPAYLLVGMKQSKDAAGFLAPMVPHAAAIWAVREPGQHLALPVEAVIAASGGVAQAGPDVAGALAQLRGLPPGRVLICGSLYLAGEVLKLDASK